MSKASQPRCWQLRHELWQLPVQGAIMGIVNCTPDSFSDGGQFGGDLQRAMQHAIELWEQGADVIDIGGESTRPGAEPVAISEEIARTAPLIAALRERVPNMRLSIDTRHAQVARAALEAGADIINDVSGLRCEYMRALCAEQLCGIILMHMKGEPRTMQQAPQYQDVVQELAHYFKAQQALALAAGIEAERICYDPGIGFGKKLPHNLALIAQLEQLRPNPESPLMMALSRKRFMGEILADAQRGRSAHATLSMSLLAAERGADLHRVHEVAELRDALKLRHALCMG